MLKKVKALAIATASVAALGLGTGAAHAVGAQPASADRCPKVHTYNDGISGPNSPVQYLEVNGWGGSGAKVATWEYVNQNGHAQDNERWCVERAAEGGYYLHPAYAYGQNGKANLCLDVPGGRYSDAPGLVVWTCNGGLNQRFNFTAPGQTGGRIYAMGDPDYSLQGHHDRSQVTLVYKRDAPTSWK